MAIDWFTVIAQLINFLVLVLLLQRFLYKPVLNAVAEREKKIAAQLANAAASEKTAQEQWQEYRQKDTALKQEAAAIIDKARMEAQTEREQLLAQARNDADRQRSQWAAALRTEQDHYGRELERQTRTTLLDTTRKLLSDLAGSTLEENMIQGFVRSLAALDAADCERLTRAMAAAPPVLRSSVPLDAATKNEVNAALKTLSPALPEPIYETDAALVCGIGLYVDGYRLEWSIDNYLRELQAALKPAGPTPQQPPNPKDNT